MKSDTLKQIKEAENRVAFWKDFLKKSDLSHKETVDGEAALEEAESTLEEIKTKTGRFV